MATKFDAKAKAKRQKIILAVLGVVFLAVLAWQVPSVLKIMNKKPVAAATTPAPVAPVPVPTAGLPTNAPGIPVASSAPTSSLVDSDPTAQAAGGQLISFDRFATKDPFAQQLGEPCDPDPTSPDVQPCLKATASKVETEPGTASPGAASKSPLFGSSTADTPAPEPTSAQISVNGEAVTVGKGNTFPPSDPVFVLVSVSRTTAKVGISGGSLDSGGAMITLKKGKKLTLENTVDGARYVLLLVSTS